MEGVAGRFLETCLVGREGTGAARRLDDRAPTACEAV
ncbi:hypothetical protein FB570_107175 [Streptomyces sp. T12]|nr:hypothetical protein FB570_107175 [Streptomyces sp. T12]